MEENMKKLLCAILVLVMLASCLVGCGEKKEENEEPKTSEELYNEALSHLDNGKYSKAYDIFKELGDYEDSKTYLESFVFVPVKAVSYSIDEGERGYETSGELVLDDKGIPVKYTVLEWSGDISSKEYTFDSDNNLIKEVSISNGWGVQTTEYTYDERGFCIKKVFTTTEAPFVRDPGTSITDYFYDDSGKLIKTVYTDTFGNVKTNDNPYQMASRNFLEGNNIVFDYSDDEHSKCEYDDNGNLIKVSAKESDDFEEIVEISYKCVYFKNGITQSLIEILSDMVEAVD
jgi:hypothetical protein